MWENLGIFALLFILGLSSDAQRQISLKETCENLTHNLANINYENPYASLKKNWGKKSLKNDENYHNLIAAYFLANGHNFATLYGCSKAAQENMSFGGISKFPVFQEGSKLTVCDPLGEGYLSAKKWLVIQHGKKFYSQMADDQEKPFCYEFGEISGLLNPYYKEIVESAMVNKEQTFKEDALNSSYESMRNLAYGEIEERKHFQKVVTRFFKKGIVDKLKERGKLELSSNFSFDDFARMLDEEFFIKQNKKPNMRLNRDSYIATRAKMWGI